MCTVSVGIRLDHRFYISERGSEERYKHPFRRSTSSLYDEALYKLNETGEQFDKYRIDL